MKFLALSDLHGDYSKVEALQQCAGEVDAVLITGDITNFGPAGKALEFINMFDVPVLAVPGNCDPVDILEVLDGSKAINLHKSCHTIGDVTFMGLGGSNTTPFDTPFELTDEDIEQSLEKLLDECSSIRNVLISHAPPYGYSDELPVGHVGSQAIAKFVDRFALVVCGHIHEARGTTMAGDTIVVNVGEASKGYGALITTNDNVSVEHIEV